MKLLGLDVGYGFVKVTGWHLVFLPSVIGDGTQMTRHSISKRT